MKRLRIDLEDLAALHNLERALWKANRGRRRRGHGRRTLDLAALAADLRSQRAPYNRFCRFTIHDPKRRVIHAPCFADRVVHHALLNLAGPRFERALAASTFACRPGMGVQAAAQAVQAGLRRAAWFVQIDIDGYFPSIDHAILKAQLRRRFKGEVLGLFDRIIDGGCVEPARARGLPIGALTSQHFANGYLNGADRHLLSMPGVVCPVRYMDDMVWFCDDRDRARRSLAELTAYLGDVLRLTRKDGARIGRTGGGLAFCGVRIRSGVLRPSSRRLTRYRRAVARITAAQAAGRVGERDVQRALDAAQATLAGTESCAFRARLAIGEPFA